MRKINNKIELLVKTFVIKITSVCKCVDYVIIFIYVLFLRVYHNNFEDFIIHFLFIKLYTEYTFLKSFRLCTKKIVKGVVDLKKKNKHSFSFLLIKICKFCNFLLDKLNLSRFYP